MRISDWSSDVCSSDLEDAKKRLRADRPDFLHDGSNRGAEKASRFAGSASSSREPKSRVLSPIVAFSKASCKNGARKKPDPVRQAAQREGSQAAFLLSSIAGMSPPRAFLCGFKIGRASCRERVC